MSHRPSRGRTRRLRDEAFKRQGGACYYCGIQMTTDYASGLMPPTLCTAEHLVPFADGGKAHKSNIVAACRRCNNKQSKHCKAAKDHNELQRNFPLRNQKPRNHQVAHALIAAFGEQTIKEILRAARKTLPSPDRGR